MCCKKNYSWVYHKSCLTSKPVHSNSNQFSLGFWAFFFIVFGVVCTCIFTWHFLHLWQSFVFHSFPENMIWSIQNSFKLLRCFATGMILNAPTTQRTIILLSSSSLAEPCCWADHFHHPVQWSSLPNSWQWTVSPRVARTNSTKSGLLGLDFTANNF